MTLSFLDKSWTISHCGKTSINISLEIKTKTSAQRQLLPAQGLVSLTQFTLLPFALPEILRLKAGVRNFLESRALLFQLLKVFLISGIARCQPRNNFAIQSQACWLLQQAQTPSWDSRLCLVSWHQWHRRNSSYTVRWLVPRCCFMVLWNSCTHSSRPRVAHRWLQAGTTLGIQMHLGAKKKETSVSMAFTF